MKERSVIRILAFLIINLTTSTPATVDPKGLYFIIL